MHHRIGVLVGFALASVWSSASADLNTDFNLCRARILSIGDDPRTPAEQYCKAEVELKALQPKRDTSGEPSLQGKVSQHEIQTGAGTGQSQDSYSAPTAGGRVTPQVVWAGVR